MRYCDKYEPVFHIIYVLFYERFLSSFNKAS